MLCVAAGAVLQCYVGEVTDTAPRHHLATLSAALPSQGGGPVVLVPGGPMLTWRVQTKDWQGRTRTRPLPPHHGHTTTVQVGREGSLGQAGSQAGRQPPRLTPGSASLTPGACLPACGAAGACEVLLLFFLGRGWRRPGGGGGGGGGVLGCGVGGGGPGLRGPLLPARGHPHTRKPASTTYYLPRQNATGR